MRGSKHFWITYSVYSNDTTLVGIFLLSYENEDYEGRVGDVVLWVECRDLQFLPQPQQTKTISIQSRTLGISTRGR